MRHIYWIKLILPQEVITSKPFFIQPHVIAYTTQIELRCIELEQWSDRVTVCEKFQQVTAILKLPVPNH